MREILKMIIEPDCYRDSMGLSENLIVHRYKADEKWRIHWLPILGTSEEMNKPISLDPTPFRQAISALENHSSLSGKNIGTSSGEIYLFINSNATPGDMKFIHETIQHAYFIHLKSELPEWLPTMTIKVHAVRADC